MACPRSADELHTVLGFPLHHTSRYCGLALALGSPLAPCQLTLAQRHVATFCTSWIFQVVFKANPTLNLGFNLKYGSYTCQMGGYRVAVPTNSPFALQTVFMSVFRVSFLSPRSSTLQRSVGCYRKGKAWKFHSAIRQFSLDPTYSYTGHPKMSEAGMVHWMGEEESSTPPIPPYRRASITSKSSLNLPQSIFRYRTAQIPPSNVSKRRIKMLDINLGEVLWRIQKWDFYRPFKFPFI